MGRSSAPGRRALPEKYTGEFQSCRGSRPMPTAWTSWTGCGGRAASSAQCAGMAADGPSPMAGTSARPAASGHQVTAGTLFDRRRTPLTVWFTACWMFAAQKRTASRRSACSGRWRSARTRRRGRCCTGCARCWCAPARDRLSGRVEVDETFIGGEEAGLRGGRARGKKSLVGAWPSRSGSHEGTGAAGWRSCPTPRQARCTASSLATSSHARR